MSTDLEQLLLAIKEQTQAFQDRMAEQAQVLASGLNNLDSRITESQAAVDSRITESQAAVDSRITESQAAVLAKLVEVEARLERIECNTIVIMGKVISDFENITPETKESLESEFTKVLENEGLVADLRAISDRAKIQRQAKITLVSKKNTFTVTTEFKKLNPTCTHGDKSAYGNWVGNVMAKAFDHQFYSVYRLELLPITRLLAQYYVNERISTRAY